MSARYSSSPSLRLVIARSRIYRIAHGGLCLLAVFSLYRLSQRGYPVLALLLAPAVGVCCWQLARQRFVGSVVCWSQGQWSIHTGGDCLPVMLKRSSCLPWVIYLAWFYAPGKSRGSVFLFSDSAPVQDLRRLRVRLTLER